MLFLRTRFTDPLLDMAARDGAIRTEEIRISRRHLLEYRAADFHRLREKFALDTPGAVVPRTALDGIDLGSGHQGEHLARLLPDILDPRMARDVVRDFAKSLLEIGFEQAVLVAHHEVLERIEHCRLDRLYAVIVGKHERQLLL